MTRPDRSGLEVLGEIKRRDPHAAVIIITAAVLVENAVAALRGGAYDFIGKPLNLEELRVTIRNGIERAFILEDGEAMTVEHLPAGVARGIGLMSPNGAHAPADVDEIIHLPPGGFSIDAVELSLVRQAGDAPDAGGRRRRVAGEAGQRPASLQGLARAAGGFGGAARSLPPGGHAR